MNLIEYLANGTPEIRSLWVEIEHLCNRIKQHDPVAWGLRERFPPGMLLDSEAETAVLRGRRDALLRELSALAGSTEGDTPG